ncbi:MAG: Phosphoesterase RecJ domain protein [Candidatus Uhrbacteria bacterium GW2011_GWD2_52_7]|uniref:Phosphoesterase RecJ domain protein n=1 Tax=Candidatus Uhrbacteria bacterium GW2011_GWD2_52_7 TaxID=1618989 RepID=A0A0G1XIW1_9BACT|nr:MAG: Phosphoesterase RecJ domain protein [Candidatus Uhrbacteria bacterium GW2011_GWD2_52_7]
MPLSPHDQFFMALERANRPLIVLKELANVDDFSAAFGIATYFSRLEKPVDIVSSGGRAPETLNFLSLAQPVRGDLPNIRSLVIKVNAQQAKVDELSYAVIDGELEIHITPKSGAWSASDVRVATENYKYDLIIAIGAPDLTSLGKLSDAYADFFAQTPIINIDHLASNEQFGNVNIVDMNASSVSEVVLGLFRKKDEDLIDPELATTLLTGMIAKTKSFRSLHVTTRTLESAATLISKGARREEIIEHLYRTRSVETLRLWGRALARLKSDANIGLAWTLLTRQDFIAAGAEEAALQDIVSELLSSSPSARVVVIFFEQPDGNIGAHLYAERPHDALMLGAPFKAVGTRETTRLTLTDTDIVAAERAVITHLKHQLEKA